MKERDLLAIMATIIYGGTVLSVSEAVPKAIEILEAVDAVTEAE